jgi:NitT/TauT family transport system ATP-binding protein
MEEKLNISQLNKSYDDLTIFRDFTLSIPKNEITSILGPSGCGKTTLLDIIAGISTADSLLENDFTGLNFSYVFQEPRLLPWKTVYGNLEFVIRDHFPADRTRDIINTYLELVELREYSGFYPDSLSGGMKQRVSLARAFCYPSDVILMDEPFQSLDIKLRASLTERFLKLWEKEKRTTLFVTHHAEEALGIGKNVILLSQKPVEVSGQFRNEETTKKLIREEIARLFSRGSKDQDQ